MLSRRGKLLLLLIIALLIILAACSGTPATGLLPGNTSNSQAQNLGTRHKLFVFLAGFTSSLSQSDVTQNDGYGSNPDFFGDGRIQPFLNTKFPGSYFLAYSYQGFTSDGKPSPYACPLSTDSDIADLAVGLRSQISQFLQNHPNTDVYIIGHSLGGIIGFSFLAQMIEGKNNLLKSLPKGGSLKGIFTLDSPLGGVTNNGLYVIISAVQTLTHCTSGNFVHQPVVKELNDLFNSATLPDFRGATASVDATITLLNQRINQTVATDAMKYGIAVATFANVNDIMWQPSLCTTQYVLPDFSSTQWLREVQAGRNSQGGAVYARSFAGGQLTCNAILNSSDAANHFAVLTDPNVQTAIGQVVAGNAPEALSTIVVKPDFSRFVGQWKEYGTGMIITSDGKATYIGRTYIFCSDDPRPPCDGGDHGLAGLNTTISFISVQGNIASGVITGGTGDRDQHNNIIPVGSTVIVTLIDKDHLHISDGRDLIMCKDDPNAIACVSNT